LLKQIDRDDAYPQLVEPPRLMDSASEYYRRNLDRFAREIQNELLFSLMHREIERLMDESPEWKHFTYFGGMSYGPWPAFFELTPPRQQ
jgi:hypothetical protein